jgi:hypothetical protein
VPKRPQKPTRTYSSFFGPIKHVFHSESCRVSKLWRLLTLPGLDSFGAYRWANAASRNERPVCSPAASRSERPVCSVVRPAGLNKKLAASQFGKLQSSESNFLQLDFLRIIAVGFRYFITLEPFKINKGMHRITTFRLTTNRINDGGPIRL